MRFFATWPARAAALAVARRALRAAGLVALAAAPVSAAVSRNVTLLAHKDDYAAGGLYSACWSYVHPDGREYAVIGHNTGTAIYNIVDPTNPYLVGFIPGAPSIWREMKQYRTWIYVTTEAVSGLQIVRMTDPESPVLANTYNLTFNQAHTVTIDTTRALLFANGTRKDGTTPNDRGLRILSLADPESPVEVGFYNPDPNNFADAWYVHDSHAVGTRLYLSCVYSGYVRVLETTDPAAPVEIASWTYPGAFTHNSWTTADEKHLFVTDEVTGEPLKVFDISNLASPVPVASWISNPAAIVHNVHIMGDTAYCSNYTEGVRLLDISDPTLPAEFGHYDTFVGTPTGVFDGCWEVAPYYPSGVMIASDRQTGLYVLRSNPVYGTVTVKVRDSATSLPVPVAVARLAGAGDSLSTPASGNVRFAPSPGADVVQVTKFGYESASAPFTAVTGAGDSVTVMLVKKPTSDLSGVVVAAAGGAPLGDAEMTLAYMPFFSTTDAGGNYLIFAVPSGQHRLMVKRPGYAFAERWLWLPGNSSETEDVSLVKAAFYDSCDTNKGWSLSAPGDNASTGLWLRADPVGASSLAAGALRGAGVAGLKSLSPLHPEPEEGVVAGVTQPEDDHTPAPSVMCFVTGNGPQGGAPGQADVDNGKTTLTSPTLDLSGMSDPTVAYWRWFYTNEGKPDHFVVDISPNNGASWVNVESLTVSQQRWEAKTIRVLDYIAPTASVNVRFVAADLGGGSLVEGLVDDFATYDAARGPVAVTPRVPAALALSAPAPNPGNGSQRMSLALPSAGPVEAVVMDVAGRAVRTLHRGFAPAGTLPLGWDGHDDHGRAAGAGLYWVRARSVAGEAAVKLVRVR